MMRVRVALVRKSPEANWNSGCPADLSGVMAMYLERADSGQVEVPVWVGGLLSHGGRGLSWRF